jgi:RNA polymerase sigma-70 factor (ECF subfamily)
MLDNRPYSSPSASDSASSDLDRETAEATSSSSAQPQQLVEHFFRHETGRLHGTLIRLLGVHNLALAEDVAQEAMLRAVRTWSMGGIPPNPSAWITRVAINLARDAMRHQRMSGSKESAIITHIEQMQPTSATAPAVAEVDNEIRDDALRLMFICCHPSIAADAQVVLALKVLCGFSTGEIARAFLTSDAAIEKQLTRTKQRIHEAGIRYEIPEGEDLSRRLEGVHSALYLLFNEGYKASAGDNLLREDLCTEAIRLTTLLVAHPAGNTPRSHALLALMLLNAARLPSRLDENGELLRLDDQDRSKWNAQMIERGLVELILAASGTELSEYHLQAGIAACHCTAPDYASTNWPRILELYDQLIRIKPSPVVALNRAVAVAAVHGAQAGLDALAAIAQRDRLDSYYLLHAVRGEFLSRLNNHPAAAEAYERAARQAKVGPEQLYLKRMMEHAQRK